MDKQQSTNGGPSSNENQTGGSYKEKQPAKKPTESKEKELPVDEDGDGKSDHSENPKGKKSASQQ